MSDALRDRGRLGWSVRIGFGAGDFAQNLLQPAVGMYLLFFYTEVFGLDPAIAATMFLAVQIADILWNLFIGAFVDRSNPPWGKYRSYLLFAGLPLAVLAALCFTDPLGSHAVAFKTVYACATYVGFTLLLTLVNIAYGALGASLSRDTDEIAILTSVRIFMANAGCLLASAGVPILVASIAGAAELPWRMAFFMGLGMAPSFLFMPLVPWLRRRMGKKRLFLAFAPLAIVGMAGLYLVSRTGWAECRPWLVYLAQFVKASGIVLATGCMWAFVPDVISHAERGCGKRLSGVVTSIMGVFFRLGMAFGMVVSGAVLSWTGHRASAAADGVALPPDAGAWTTAMLAVALVAAVFFVLSFMWTKERVVMGVAESSKVGAIDVWEMFRGCRPLRMLSLFFFLVFAMMSVGNAAGAYFMNGLEAQLPRAQEGIRWLVGVIPAVLALISMAVMSCYPLTDDLVDKMNGES